jgi:hypothetical protein
VITPSLTTVVVVVDVSPLLFSPLVLSLVESLELPPHAVSAPDIAKTKRDCLKRMVLPLIVAKTLFTKVYVASL